MRRRFFITATAVALAFLSSACSSDEQTPATAGPLEQTNVVSDDPQSYSGNVFVDIGDYEAIVKGCNGNEAIVSITLNIIFEGEGQVSVIVETSSPTSTHEKKAFVTSVKGKASFSYNTTESNRGEDLYVNISVVGGGEQDNSSRHFQSKNIGPDGQPLIPATQCEMASL